MKHWLIVVLPLLVACKAYKSKHFKPDFSPGPAAIVYKTKADYSKLVPVTLSDDKTEIIVETSEGTFTSEVMEPQKIDKKVKSYFIANIQDLKGDIKKVTVTSIYDLDSDGNPLKDSKREIIVYNK